MVELDPTELALVLLAELERSPPRVRSSRIALGRADADRVGPGVAGSSESRAGVADPRPQAKVVGRSHLAEWSLEDRAHVRVEHEGRLQNRMLGGRRHPNGPAPAWRPRERGANSGVVG